MKPTYESPLASRYASKTMLHLFSPDMRYETWRRLWVALARAEHTLGLPVTQQQVDELAAHVSPIDYDAVAKREKEVRHDVMAHIYAYGLDAPGAKGIIHLGATSCYVTDNADLIIYREALRYLEKELKAAMRNLCDFADRYAAMPALAYTHYQPAQLTTSARPSGCRICCSIWRSCRIRCGPSASSAAAARPARRRASSSCLTAIRRRSTR